LHLLSFPTRRSSDLIDATELGPSVFGRTTLDSRFRGNDEKASVPAPPGRETSIGQPNYLAAGAGAGAGLLKSTVRGTLIPFSFSTEKLGLTSILNSIAVRLVGNVRTVVLNSCTDLM